MVELNNIYKLECIGINNYAKGVSKIESLLVFVDDFYPEEIAEVKITKKEKNFAYGKIINLIVESPHRIKSVCSHSIESGTCPFSDIDYDYECELKGKMVLNNINRALKTNIETVDVISGDIIDGYRNKVTVFFNDKYEFGYFKEESNDFVKVDSCVQIEEEIRKIIISLLSILKKNDIECANYKKKTGIIKGVSIRKSSYTKKISVMILATKDMNDEFLKVSEELKSLYKNITGISFNINREYETFIYSGSEHQYYGDSYIQEKIYDSVLKVNNMSFLQVNTSCASKLYSEAIKMANLKKNMNVIDLYSGCGGISLNAAKFVNHVYAIETVKSAIELARKNAIYNNVSNATFYVGDSKDFNTTIKEKNIDCLFVDPPRAGLSKETVNEILKQNFITIIYISCDSFTLARDLKLLQEKYNLISIKTFNMFPRTKHVETVCLLELKK